MNSQFSVAMSKRSDAELLIIVNERRNDYQVEAIQAAELELAKRNLSQDHLQQAKEFNQDKRQIEIQRANIKLDGVWKILAFIFPGIILLLLAGIFKADGYDRKASELGKWTGYGFGFYFTIVILIVLLS